MASIYKLLIKSSKDYPNKEAVVCGGRRFSYSELEEASTRLANFLIAQGVNHGDRIGIFCNKDIEEIIAIFAILKIGAIFVHINPQFMESQLRHVISDCNIKVLFVNDIKSVKVTKAYPKKCPINLFISLSTKINLNGNVPKNIHFLKNILKESVEKQVSYDCVDENDIASIIYTSGSTGMPKGVIVTHKIFYNSTIASASVFENNSNDRLISVTPFSFDGALSQLFTSFLVGGTLVLQKSNFPKDIVKTLLDEKITGFHAVPTLWILLLQKYSPFPKYDYPHLRYISIIGEAFPQDYLDKLKNVLKETKFYMMYGTTEAFRSTYLPPDDFEKKKSSVGKPFPGVEILIMDKRDNLCKPGETGEIVHKGAFISPGYWNNTKKSIESFRRNRLYTGDLGKLDNDGYLYFIGRKDGMIKTSGYRVSPEEIEKCLYEIEEIKEVAVVGVPCEETGSIIKAIVVCKDDSFLTQKDVINYCKKRLPSYMIPRQVEFRESLPKTSTHKINKSELLKSNIKVNNGMKRCISCVIPETFPGINFDYEGVCSLCTKFKENKSPIISYEKLKIKFEKLIKENRSKKNKYDALVAFSGGKDSTFLIYTLKQKYSLNLLAVTFDNGFMSEVSFSNISKVLEKLNVDHIIFKPRYDLITTIFSISANREIYPISLLKFGSSICISCIRMVTNLSLKTAIEKDIPMVMIGNSPGQLIQSESEIMYQDNRIPYELRKKLFKPLADEAGDEIYDYFLLPKEKYKTKPFPYTISPFPIIGYDENTIYNTIAKFGWKRPNDVDPNSSNCRLNSYGIISHIKNLDFHPYEYEMSMLVRLGQISRNEALKRVEDPEKKVLNLSKEIEKKLNESKNL